MANTKNKKKISSTKQEQNETIVIDFSFPTSLVSVKVDGFNNYLKNDDAAFKRLNFCLNDLTKHFSYQTKNSIRGLKHCHIIDEPDKLAIIEKAVRNAYKKTNDAATEENIKNFYDQNLKDTTISQLGFIKGIRLIGYFERDHHFKVILIDYNHSLYPSVKYNDEDYDNYNVCFYERGKES